MNDLSMIELNPNGTMEDTVCHFCGGQTDCECYDDAADQDFEIYCMERYGKEKE